MTTKIEWTVSNGQPGYTFNPWSGCSKISAGCAHCYAANLPPGMRRGASWGQNADRIPAAESTWAQPLAWNRKAQKLGARLRVFCASTADVFEDRADLDVYRERLWKLIQDTPHLDWLLLTKRPHVMAAWAKTHPWPVNAWAGTSVEDQSAAEARIPYLLEVPARVRFLSCEPLLYEVRLDLLDVDGPPPSGEFWTFVNCLTGRITGDDPYYTGRPRIHWVIVGGESGHKARPMRLEWATMLRDQCARAHVPFFFKQWGTHDAHGESVGKHEAGRLLEGIEYNGQPADE